MSQTEHTQVVTSEDIPSPQVDDNNYRRLGMLVLGLLVGVFGVWSIFAPLESAVPAPGKVIVASNNRVIQHLEGGIVQSINVKDGDSVKIGQVLIQLDKTQPAAQLKMIEAQYYEALALESRLIAERDNAGSISFSPELASMSDKIHYALITEGQRREFNARAKELSDQKQVLSERILQIQNQIEGLKAIIESKSNLSASYNDEIKEWEQLYKEQLIDKIKLRDIKRQKVQTDGDIANAKSDMARAKGQISEINAQIITQRQTFLKEVVGELRDVQTKLADMRARITALKDTLSRTAIVSPVSGTVTNLSIHTIGGVVPPGKPILEVVPAGEPLIIEGKVAATDIINVHTGLKADVQFPSFAHVKTLNEVKGEVVTIAPDTVADETTHALYYPVKIRITPEGEAELRRNHLSIQPGIPADAMIVVASRTFADYLIHPFKTMFMKSFNEQ